MSPNVYELSAEARLSLLSVEQFESSKFTLHLLFMQSFIWLIKEEMDRPHFEKVLHLVISDFVNRVVDPRFFLRMFSSSGFANAKKVEKSMHAFIFYSMIKLYYRLGES